MLTTWVRAAFPETRTVLSGTRGRGDHSATVKQTAVVGLYFREESAEALAKRSASVGRHLMLRRTSSLVCRLLPRRDARRVRTWPPRSKNWSARTRPCMRIFTNSRLSLTHSRVTLRGGQSLPLADHRLLRRDGHQLGYRDQTGCGSAYEFNNVSS